MRAERLARIVAGVIRQALRDAGAEGVLLLDAGSPEGALARDWCGRVAPVWDSPGERRVLVAHPGNKTALLLGGVPQAMLLPLGDLYASEVAELTGDWSAPEPVRALVAGSGDVAYVDAVLRRWAEGREGAECLPPALASAVAASRFSRQRPGLVPKLGGRTIGIDLWE